jgi:type IV pilus assembly protein PilN
MIKINLVAETPAAAVTKRKRPEISLGARQGDIILVTTLLLSVAVVGGWGYYLHSKLEGLRRIEAEKKQERDKLQQFIDKVEELEAKREALKHKIQVIEDLKMRQQGPVRIMDEVSRSLPDLVWLTKLDLKGTELSLSGVAMDENAVANYLANLTASPFFQEPTLKNLQRSSDATFDFQLSCVFTYTPPELKGSEVTDTTAQPRANPRPRRPAAERGPPASESGRDVDSMEEE